MLLYNHLHYSLHFLCFRLSYSLYNNNAYFPMYNYTSLLLLMNSSLSYSNHLTPYLHYYSSSIHSSRILCFHSPYSNIPLSFHCCSYKIYYRKLREWEKEVKTCSLMGF